jgi:hypothetical protein
VRAIALHLIVCAAAALTPILTVYASPPAAASLAAAAEFPGWPESFEGRALTRLAATELDARFLADLPGRVARFSDGEREILIRWSATPTRHLHPSANCLRAVGWDTSPRPLTITADGSTWSTYVATRGSERLEVRERVVDTSGRTWAEPTAWYWASLLGETSGPAWAYTVSRRID